MGAIEPVVLRKATSAIPASGLDSAPQRWRAVSFGERGYKDGQLAFPTHLAATDSLVAVADTVNDRVQLFKPDGTFVRTLTTADGVKLRSPMGVAINERSDTVLVADTENHRVVVFAADGSVMRIVGTRGRELGQLQYPVDVAFAVLGDIIVADADNDRIQVFNPRTGAFVRSFGTCGSGHGQLRQPFGVTVHQDVVFVADCYNHRVQAFNAEGRFMWAVGTRGAGPTSFDHPQSIAVDRQGRVYVADAHNNRVQVLSVTGMFSHSIVPTGDDSGLERPRGVAVEYDDGILYVADTNHHRIVRLSNS